MFNVKQKKKKEKNKMSQHFVWVSSARAVAARKP